MASPVAYTQAEAARLEAEHAADRERAEREAADQEAARADKEAADEAAAREAADAADQEAAARDAADRERADEEAADEEAADQEAADTEAADGEAADQEATDQEAADHAAAEPATPNEPAAAARRAAQRRWRAALQYVKTEAKIRCTLRALRPEKAAPCVMDRLRDASAVARRLAELEGEMADDARASAAILQMGVVELGGSSAELAEDAFAARRSAQEALVQTLVARAPPATPVVAGPPVAISDGGEWRDALENFEDDVDKRFAERGAGVPRSLRIAGRRRRACVYLTGTPLPPLHSWSSRAGTPSGSRSSWTTSMLKSRSSRRRK